MHNLPSLFRRPFATPAWTCGLLGIAVVLVATLPAAAAVPTDAEDRAPLVGQPTAVIVQPSAITLAGPRAMQQIVVTGRYANSPDRDLTHLCDLSVEAADLVDLSAGGFLQP